jgi:hypothetical protein
MVLTAMRKTLIAVAGLAAVAGLFLLFRPDKLFADDPVSESFEGAILSATTSTGSFTGINHSASGTATIYKQNGAYVLRFEDDTDIQNGPDLYVWLLATDSYTGRAPTEYIDLGKLKGNVGGQNYQLPDGFDPSLHRAVLIWCLRFGVPFAGAPLN